MQSARKMPSPLTGRLGFESTTFVGFSTAAGHLRYKELYETASTQLSEAERQALSLCTGSTSLVQRGEGGREFWRNGLVRNCARPRFGVGPIASCVDQFGNGVVYAFEVIGRFSILGGF